jgi:hypothetical protein
VDQEHEDVSDSPARPHDTTRHGSLCSRYLQKNRQGQHAASLASYVGRRTTSSFGVSRGGPIDWASKAHRVRLRCPRCPLGKRMLH